MVRSQKPSTPDEIMERARRQRAGSPTEPEQARIVRRLIGEATQRSKREERFRVLTLVVDTSNPVTETDLRKAADVQRLQGLAQASQRSAVAAREAAKTAHPTEQKRLRKTAAQATAQANHRLRLANETAIALERDRADRADRLWLEGALDETAAAEIGHGELVERPSAGGLRIRTRDGLKRMFETGGLAERQFKAAALFRPTYETCRGSIASQLGRQEGSRSSAQTDGGWVAAKLLAITARGDAEKAIHRVFLHLGHRTRQGMDAILVVEQVAGEGHSIRSLAASSRRRDYLADLLRRALEALADHYGLQPGP